MQLLYWPTPKEIANDPLVSIRADQAWLQAWQRWRIWLQVGLAGFSPNLAPVVWDADELRQQTSLLAYHNLTTLADGSLDDQRSIRQAQEAHAGGYRIDRPLCQSRRHLPRAGSRSQLFLVISSDGLVERVRVKLVGSSGFIAKPISSEKVLSTLQQYLSGEHLASSND